MLLCIVIKIKRKNTKYLLFYFDLLVASEIGESCFYQEACQISFGADAECVSGSCACKENSHFDGGSCYKSSCKLLCVFDSYYFSAYRKKMHFLGQLLICHVSL